MEQQIVSQELSDLAELYQSLVAKVTSEAVALGLIQEIGKNQRVRMMANREARELNFSAKPSADSPATWAQKSKLRFLKVEFPENISKRDASILIDQSITKLEQ